MIISGAKIKSIIFDLDGTLYNNAFFTPLLILKCFSRLRLIYSLPRIRRILAGQDKQNINNFEQVFFTLLAEQSHTTITESQNWYNNKFYPSFISILKFFPARQGTGTLLYALRNSGIKLAVLSDYSHIDRRLTAIGLAPELFDCLVSCEELGALKPCPRPFIETAYRLDSAPSHTLLIGDRCDTDGAGAEACGMPYYIISNKMKTNCILWKELYQLLLNSAGV